MSDDHKAALAAGREQSRAVRQYLEALDSQRPKRGRRRTTASIEKRISDIDTSLAIADPLARVLLVQERMDLHAELNSASDPVHLSALEEGFVAAALAYSSRKGLTYAAWRQVGVRPQVLKRAGIPRTRSS